MYTHLDHLQEFVNHQKSTSKPSNVFKEIKIFGIIFVIVSVVLVLFTNVDLFFAQAENIDDFSHEKLIYHTQGANTNSRMISTIVASTQKEMGNIDHLVEEYKEQIVVDSLQDLSTNVLLSDKLASYELPFNILPPTNRLIIDKFGLDVPLIDSQYKVMEDFTKGNYDKELQKGVVKYPTTPVPGKVGNTLIFGHTSQERWKENPYATVFAKIPELKNGDTFQIVWNGQLYTYEMIDTVTVKPSKVNDIYMKYQNLDDDYVTLMGCYPLGTDRQRMMVIAKRIH